MQQKEKKEEGKNLTIRTKRKLITNLKNNKMDLNELKKMIKEEWYSFKEQEGAPTTTEPAVAVSDDDIDAMGGEEDAESTLRQIYDMLDAYFNAEGGAAAAAGDDADMDDEEMADMADDMEDDEDDDDVAEGPGDTVGKGCSPTSPCPSHQKCVKGKCESGATDKKDDKDDKKESKKDKEELKERFQKLANIIKG
jgi:hypothetical protein